MKYVHNQDRMWDREAPDRLTFERASILGPYMATKHRRLIADKVYSKPGWMEIGIFVERRDKNGSR